MKKFNSIDDILDFAIDAEQNAIEFYSGLFNKTDNASMKEAYKEFILEEKSHRDKLQKMKDEEILANFDNSKVTDMKISDYISKQEPYKGMSYEESLVVAMQKEKAAYKLYSYLAEIAKDTEIKKVFSFLAAEEAKHKLKFEIEYDNNVFKEN